MDKPKGQPNDRIGPGQQTTPISLDFIAAGAQSDAVAPYQVDEVAPPSAHHVLVSANAADVANASYSFQLTNPSLSGNLPDNLAKFHFKNAGAVVYVGVWLL